MANERMKECLEGGSFRPAISFFRAVLTVPVLLRFHVSIKTSQCLGKRLLGI